MKQRMIKPAGKQLLGSGLAAAAMVALSACGGSDGNGSPYGGAPAPTRSQAATTTTSGLATHEVSGVGTVLTDSAGRTLYVADQETDGTVRCTDACAAVWIPVIAASASAPAGVDGMIGTVDRSDTNQTQLTYDGGPLYTFFQDSAAGEAKGNNLSDDFGDTRFSWHAVVINPVAGGSPPPSSDNTDSTDGTDDGYPY